MSDDPQSKSPAASTELPRERNAGSSHWVRRLGRAIADFATDPEPRGLQRTWPWILIAAILLLGCDRYVPQWHSTYSAGGVLFHGPAGWTQNTQAALTTTMYRVETTSHLNWLEGIFTYSAEWVPRKQGESAPGNWQSAIHPAVIDFAESRYNSPQHRRLYQLARTTGEITVRWRHPLYWPALVFPVLVLVLLVGLVWIASLRWIVARSWGAQNRTFRHGRCPRCRYSLKGIDVQNCPECGFAPYATLPGIQEPKARGSVRRLVGAIVDPAPQGIRRMVLWVFPLLAVALIWENATDAVTRQVERSVVVSFDGTAWVNGAIAGAPQQEFTFSATYSTGIFGPTRLVNLGTAFQSSGGGAGPGHRAPGVRSALASSLANDTDRTDHAVWSMVEDSIQDSGFQRPALARSPAGVVVDVVAWILWIIVAAIAAIGLLRLWRGTRLRRKYQLFRSGRCPSCEASLPAEATYCSRCACDVRQAIERVAVNLRLTDTLEISEVNELQQGSHSGQADSVRASPVP